MVMRLKGVKWTPHLMDLVAHENKSEWYLKNVNPRGLVPVLVDDGKVIVESNDIVDYLDAKFPPLLGPASDRDSEDDLHLSMRAMTFTFGIPPVLAKPPKQKMEAYREYGKKVEGPGQDHDTQVEFWTRYDANGGCSGREIVVAYDRICEAFGGLEARLEGKTFFGGDEVSLNDIVWFPTVHRLALVGFDLEARCPRLSKWRAACLADVPSIGLEAEKKSTITKVFHLYQRFITGATLEQAVAKYRAAMK
ncbi:hypothetical protein CTAYLR_000988 [Chrysophaeum taylorii]|uniref:Glutathione S-transferase n=1 Tax=Chrysophaeum taylorii TaxID=2483200 RepID=A0AAD7XJI3_9STRA|nr:hypothetical protein CTAYLR_000988 [Chrysophaeum taylorii]